MVYHDEIERTELLLLDIIQEQGKLISYLLDQVVPSPPGNIINQNLELAKKIRVHKRMLTEDNDL